MKKIVCRIKGHDYKLIARYLNSKKIVYKCTKCNKLKTTDVLAEWI